METDRLRLKNKTLQSVMEQCQQTLDQFKDADPKNPNLITKEKEDEEERGAGGDCSNNSSTNSDYDSDELRDLIKSKVESPNFLAKLGSIHMSSPHCNFDDSASWDIIGAKDLWEDEHISGDNESDQDGYVLVKQEDIVEGIACFMAAYLLSLEQTKELTPKQLQEVLSKTFSVKKKKSKLQKAWDGSRVIYNVASWSATAIGIYQNPALLQAASVAFLTSCRAISRFL